MSLAISTICFIACHGGPADHFATYAQALTQHGYHVDVYATGPALKKFQERGMQVKSFSLDDLPSEAEDNLADQIARTCSSASVVITDVGHPFNIKMQKALEATKVTHLAYYDNPEPFVPGGYSKIAAEVMQIAQGILFANATLANAKIYNGLEEEIDFGHKKRFGIGYYPVDQAEKISKRRALEQKAARSTLLEKSGIKDENQKVWVYFGGNNDEYFANAFPAFLRFLEEAMEQVDFSKIVIVIQQHPGAKAKNLDGQRVDEWKEKFAHKASAPKLLMSDFSSDEAQVVADAAFYYQTSMGPQFALAHIPSTQIGHKPYEDILVKNQMAFSVSSADQLIDRAKNLNQGVEKNLQRDVILNKLGIKPDWFKALDLAIHESLKK
jgi:hypothetical protein